MSAPNQFRSVLLCDQQQGFYSINEYNPLYDPLHHVLMFPRGEHGYALQDASGKRSRVSPLQHYQRVLQIRQTIAHPIERFGKLYHEYIVDMYAKIEKGRLDFVNAHQIQLQASTYQSVRDFCRTHDIYSSLENHGRPVVILPNSFTGGPRWYHARYLDGMNMVHCIGSSSLLICSSK
jgi:hypothetical protein